MNLYARGTKYSYQGGDETMLVLIHWHQKRRHCVTYDVIIFSPFLFVVLCQHCATRLQAHDSRFSVPTRSKQNRAIRTLASDTFWASNGFIRSRYLGEINTIAIIYTVRNRRLHTSRVRLVYLYEACSLYRLNGKWHIYVAKRWSIGWYNPHVTTYTVGDTLRMHVVHKSDWQINFNRSNVSDNNSIFATTCFDVEEIALRVTTLMDGE